MAAEVRWVEVWSGPDPAVPGKLLEAAGIEMRLAAQGWGAHGGGALPALSLLRLFMRKKPSGGARLLVAQSNVARAKTVLREGSAE